MTSAATKPSSVNRLKSNDAGRHMISDYWERIFTANERNASVVWYNGAALNPIFQAAGLEWAHGEAFAARLSAQKLEKSAQLAAQEYGYVGELCSYARTHLGTALLAKQAREKFENGIVDEADRDELASRLPMPNFIVNSYAGCSTGQQWDELTMRVLGKEVPIFNVSLPFLWSNRADAGYLQGQEWEEASDYVADQLHKLIEFIEFHTKRPFDWEALREGMHYIKQAAEIRRDAMAMCRSKPTPATFWDWIASVAHINFLPAGPELVTYFSNIREEIVGRLARGETAIKDEKYRLYFDGIMNWNKLGTLARVFAEHKVAIVAGRYTHNAFWQEPHLIDTDDPIRGMAQHYLLCPTNHGFKTIKHFTEHDCDYYGLDGIVFHSTRTCRAFTGPQQMLARAMQKDHGLPSIFFEGDVADESFYKGELLESRLEAMLETIDVRRSRDLIASA
ncbi:2-hydroxyacyl-CoA dehydratase family protein [Spongiibacter taiwanensis]|uniref:2-hydroxyacyl-CoA dehydratase subunit D n=1 Tax=Spongiibacter taiwanensis TaxID=1748242 RepID=UPI0020355028|nr:2-hydroxyacyl-CoA dehydratase family protein [Spongiibacter taiwanensis]USA42004.1 2-hydroxyacyl-CoA dehydratase family protein [Spongiibacter taiwanensis]